MDEPAVIQAARLRGEARLSCQRSQWIRHRARRERRLSEDLRARSAETLDRVYLGWTLDRVAGLAPLAELSDVVLDPAEVAGHCLELPHSERPLLRLVAGPLDD